MIVKNELNKKTLGLANKITISRLILLPFVFGFLIGGYIIFQYDKPPSGFWNLNIRNTTIYMNWAWLTGAILFIIAAFTDYIDGYVARKRNEVTVFGKFLDPIADKLLINGTLIILAWANIVPVWVVILFIARDIIVDAARMISASQDVVVAANIFGKLKTFAQIIAIIIALFLGTELVALGDSQSWSLYSESVYINLINIPMYIAVFLSVMSGFIYIKQLWPFITKTM